MKTIKTTFDELKKRDKIVVPSLFVCMANRRLEKLSKSKFHP